MTNLPNPGNLRQARVLCVDDNLRVLIGLKRQLGRRFDVLTAGSGAEGLELLEKDGSVSVIVSDLRMPEMDGIEFLREARELCPDATRLILTAYGDLLELSTALENELVFRVLDKPCHTATLLAAVDEALERYEKMVNAA